MRTPGRISACGVRYWLQRISSCNFANQIFLKWFSYLWWYWFGSIFTLAITTTTGATNTTMMCTISTTNTTITCWGSSLKPVVAAEHLTPTPSPLLHLEQKRDFSFFPTVHKIFFIVSLGNAKAINLCIKAWIALRSSSPLITIHQQQAAVYRPVGRQAAWK